MVNSSSASASIRVRLLPAPHVLSIAKLLLRRNGFLYFWYSMALSQRVWVMAVFALGHAAVGLGLTYYTIAGFLNHTLIRVSASQLDISHGPLPWPGKKRLDSTTVAQIYCKEHISRGKTARPLHIKFMPPRMPTSRRS